MLVNTWGLVNTWAGSAATISAVSSVLGADNVQALSIFTITLDDSTGVTAVTANAVACTSVTITDGITVTAVAPKGFNSPYGSSIDIVVNNGAPSAGYAVTCNVPVGVDGTAGATETDFTVDYANLDPDSPFYGVPEYSAITAGPPADSTIYDTYSIPVGTDSPVIITMSGTGVFTGFSGITEQHSFGVFTFDASDNTVGTNWTIYVDPTTVASLSSGSFAISAASISSFHTQLSAVSSGTFTLSGTSVATLHQQVSNLSSGAFSVSGTDISSSASATYTSYLDSGSITVSGTAIGTLTDLVSHIDTAAFSVAGSLIFTGKNSLSSLQAAAFSISESAVYSGYNRLGQLSQGVFSISGTAITTLHEHVSRLSEASLTLSGSGIGTAYNHVSELSSGLFSISEESVTSLLINQYTSRLDGLAMNVSGGDVTGVYHRLSVASPASYTVAGAMVGFNSILNPVVSFYLPVKSTCTFYLDID